MSDLVNVVLTFAGRKAYLCDLLRAGKGCGRVVALDADPLATVRVSADDFVLVPAVEDEDAYVRSLAHVAERYAPAVALPLNDLDLAVLARHRQLLGGLGLNVLGCTTDDIALTITDKLAAERWLERHGIVSPATELLPPEPGAPGAGRRVVKARYGQAGEGLAFLESGEAPPPSAAPRVCQPRIAGEEHHVDVLVSGRGRLLALVAKRKLLMKWGSTDKAVSVPHQPFLPVGEKLAASRAFAGSIDLDVIQTADGPVVIDVNPRLGGGFPFTALLQPSYVDLLLAVGRGEEPEPRLGGYEPGRVGHRDFAFRLESEDHTPAP
jgi:carbamoyl-phosphate synthase large subunit